MAEDKKSPPRSGGAKGGARYPRTDLKKAVAYAKRLVGKTHTGPQPENIVLPGVFDSAADAGRIRASSLKQYDLMEGTAKGYFASDLAKDIAASPEDEVMPLLQQAIFKASVFKQMYDTYQGDDTTRAKLKQKALALSVHLEVADNCVETFLTSCEYAGLARIDGDAIHLVSSQEIQQGKLPDALDENPSDRLSDNSDEDGSESKPEKQSVPILKNDAGRPAAAAIRAGVTVNFDITSSLDTDKLRVQLELLRKFGVI